MLEWHKKGEHCWSCGTADSCGLLCLLLIRNSSLLLWVTVPVSPLINSESKERALTWREAPSDGSIKFAEGTEEGEGQGVIMVTSLRIFKRKKPEMTRCTATTLLCLKCQHFPYDLWLSQRNASDNELLARAALPSHHAHQEPLTRAGSAPARVLWSAPASTAFQQPTKVSHVSQQHLLYQQRS